VAPNLEKRLLRQWGFKNREDLEVYLGSRLRDLIGPAQALIRAFEKELEHWTLEYLAGQRERFVARIEAPPPGREGIGGNTLLKQPARVAEKIFKSWRDFEVWEKIVKSRCGDNPPVRHDPQTFLQTVPDIVRFRIICNYLKDLRFIDDRVRTYAENEPGLSVETREDHISTLFPCSRVGHRAIEYTLGFKESDARFLFEVQKKDHHLIYEYTRAGKGERIPIPLRNRVAAMSELLYVADTIFDELLNEITTIMHESRS
jgi:hypothetical protein